MFFVQPLPPSAATLPSQTNMDRSIWTCLFSARFPASGNGAAVAMCPVHTPALHQQPGSCIAWKDPNERIEPLYWASAIVVHPVPSQKQPLNIWIFLASSPLTPPPQPTKKNPMCNTSGLRCWCVTLGNLADQDSRSLVIVVALDASVSFTYFRNLLPPCVFNKLQESY